MTNSSDPGRAEPGHTDAGDSDAGRGIPPLVRAARRAAGADGFAGSCRDEVGRLLATLAAAVGDGTVGESGAGHGVGTAWLRSGLAAGGRLVTVESDARRAAATAALFADDPAVRVLHADWRALADHAPYRLLFCDGGGKQDGPDAMLPLLAPGGVVVLDDFSPSDEWPPRYAGVTDTLRLAWLTDPRFTATEVGTATDATAIIATRR